MSYNKPGQRGTELHEVDEKFVYFIADGYDAIKIGIADYVPSRLNGIQGAHAYRLRLLGTKSGGFTYEQHLHLEFEHLHLRGEWFKAEGKLLDYVEEHFPLSLDYVTQRRAELNVPKGSTARRDLRLIRRAREDAKVEDKIRLSKYEKRKKSLERRIETLKRREQVAINNAKKKAAHIVVEATSAAKQVVCDAQEKSEAIMNDAKYREAVIVSNAQTLANNIVSEALLQSGMILVVNGYQLDIPGIIAKAENEAVQIRAEARGSVQSAKDKVKNIVDDAKYREANIISMAEQQAAGILLLAVQTTPS